MTRPPKYPNHHPLRLLFAGRKFTDREGMNLLQDPGLISDLCVEPEDVAPCDVERVLAMRRYMHP